MALRKPKQWDTVALREALPEHRLRAGQVGTILEIGEDGRFLIEFLSARREPAATCAVTADDFLVLQLDTDALQKRNDQSHTFKRYLAIALLVAGMVAILAGAYFLKTEASGEALLATGRYGSRFQRVPVDGSIFHVLGILLCWLAFFVKK